MAGDGTGSCGGLVAESRPLRRSHEVFMSSVEQGDISRQESEKCLTKTENGSCEQRAAETFFKVHLL